MKYLSSDGIPRYPYISYGSDLGIIPQCDEIDYITFTNCSRFVYETCDYTCNNNKRKYKKWETIKCLLRGPKHNVTFKWSKKNLCSRKSNLKLFNMTDKYVVIVV